MVVITPPRSLTQRMSALDCANAVRIPRARLKERVKAGDLTAAVILADPPVCALTMKVWDLLLAQPHWGSVKVNKVFWRLQMSPSKTVAGLSTRQRVRLIDELAGR
jgi:hypothetical protein